MDEFKKEKSPELQILDSLRSLKRQKLEARAKLTKAVDSNYVQVRPEPESCEERILNCIHNGNEKIQLLLILPELCNWIRDRREPRLESRLGSASFEALDELHLNQVAWLESKRKAAGPPLPAVNESNGYSNMSRSQNHNTTDEGAGKPKLEPDLGGNESESLRKKRLTLRDLAEGRLFLPSTEESSSTDGSGGISMSSTNEAGHLPIPTLQDHGDHVRCDGDEDLPPLNQGLSQNSGRLLPLPISISHMNVKIRIPEEESLGSSSSNGANIQVRVWTQIQSTVSSDSDDYLGTLIEEGSSVPGEESRENLYVGQVIQEVPGSSSSERDKRDLVSQIQDVLKRDDELSVTITSSTSPSLLQSEVMDISMEEASQSLVELSRPPAESSSEEASITTESSNQVSTVTSLSSSSTDKGYSDLGSTNGLGMGEMDDAQAEIVSVGGPLREQGEDRLRLARIEAVAFGIPLNDYLLQQVQASYAIALRSLVQNTETLSWVRSEFGLDSKGFLPAIMHDRRPGVSKGLVSFYKYMSGLQRLAREKLLTTAADEDRRMTRLRTFWAREKFLFKELWPLEETLENLHDDWNPQLQRLIASLDLVNEKIKRQEETAYEQAKDIARESITSLLEHEKINSVTMDSLALRAQKMEAGKHQNKLSSLATERSWKMQREQLEDKLHKLIGKYDWCMTIGQEMLDDVEEKCTRNAGLLSQLQKDLDDTDERFEEMRITKKLKELLRNIEMADSFKRNRAARVIQSAWRRYRARKLRRQRRREKIRRKPRIPGSRGKRSTEDTVSEASYATSRLSSQTMKKSLESSKAKKAEPSKGSKAASRRESKTAEVKARALNSNAKRQ